MIKLTHKDGCGILIDMSDIRSVKQIFETDVVYNTVKEFSLITYRDGTTVLVTEGIDEIDQIMDNHGGY